MIVKCTTVITTYNRRHCIERAVNSSLQEFPGHEIVIVDDASTDDTTEFIKNRYAEEIRKKLILLECLQKNVGVSGAKNIGYELSRGDWVLFLDSDDYYEKNSGKFIEDDLGKSRRFPIVFFRCRTQTGKFVGDLAGSSMRLDLETYLRHTSFGEALTAVNKDLIATTAPYVQSLRGYEGIGCARLIKKFGPAHLSIIVGRVYVTSGEDRLSVNKGLLLRMPLLAKGHFQMIREFSQYMSAWQIIALSVKALAYYILGNSYRILSSK